MADKSDGGGILGEIVAVNRHFNRGEKYGGFEINGKNPKHE